MAFSLNGTSYIESTSTPVTAEPFTMACWFNPATLTDGALMAIGNSATTNRFQMSSNAAQAGRPLSISSVAATTATVNTTTAIVQNSWQHAAAVCGSSSNRSIYLNGGGKQTNATPITPAGINNIMMGGRWSGGTRAFFFNGRLAEIAIWNIALTDDEVLSLSKGFAPSLIRPMNLRFYNRCIQRSQDLYGGRTLTQVNITNFDHPRIYG